MKRFFSFVTLILLEVNLIISLDKSVFATEKLGISNISWEGDNFLCDINTNSSYIGNLIAALYDTNGQLLNVSNNSPKELKNKWDVKLHINTGVGIAKFMLWNELNDMCPLTTAKEISLIKPGYDEQPITPFVYQNILGSGMDVDWSKTNTGRQNYTSKIPADFSNSGINHVRIRIKDDISDELFVYLDRQIDDCLNNDLIPIIAYQADYFKNNPDENNIQKVVNWWSAIAERYKDKSYLLSFDLLIEATDELNKKPEKLNELYERVVSEIRKTNKERIIIISPRLRSNPQYLCELNIPTEHNGYLMAEWHFYASGPSKTNEKKLWTTGTDEEKRLITDKINLALDWQKETGIPTWVGAWMPGNYNDGNSYSIDEQCVFADFMTKSLKNANIPFAVNSDTKFYNSEKQIWITEMNPVFRTIFNYNEPIKNKF